MYIYSPSKNSRSGTTMQKQKLRGSDARWHLARAVKSGFPRTESFSSELEIKEYLSGDSITCLLCGRELKTIALHLSRIHGISVERYRLQFNIPVKFSLVCSELVARKSKSVNSEVNKAILRAAHALSMLARKNAEPRKPACYVPMSAERATANLAGATHAPKHTDYSWHLRMAGDVYDYPAISPPPGAAAWSTFKKARLRDKGLQDEFTRARSSRQKMAIIRPKRARDIEGR